MGFLDDIFGTGKSKKTKHSQQSNSDDDDDDSSSDNDNLVDDEVGDQLDASDAGASDDGSDEDEEDAESESDVSPSGEAEQSETEEWQSDEAGSQPVRESAKVRENPYLPPVSATAASKGKYVPPSLRKKLEESSGESDEKRALRRQCHGLLNRLSEANIASIIGEFQQIFLHNARQSVTSTITSILIEMTGQRAILHDNFVIVYGALVAALYKQVGVDFGAYFIQTLVETFDSHFKDSEKGKECSNLMVLLSQLYSFQVVGCSLIYDFIRLFLSDITELNTELLLKLITSKSKAFWYIYIVDADNCLDAGAQLRHDDPAALKDIIGLLQDSVKKIPSEQLK